MMATLTPSSCGNDETQPLLEPKQPLMSPPPLLTAPPNDESLNNGTLFPPTKAALQTETEPQNDNCHLGMARKQVESCPKILENGNVWFRMQFRTVCEICVLMPLLGLVACLIVALIFQFEHIQETACKVSTYAF